jgi:hypothetical protein
VLTVKFKWRSISARGFRKDDSQREKNEMDEQSVIGHFASACERMNDFARSLRGSADFIEVKTGADIRSYESGWRLEKWVEVLINQPEGLWAAWWLELGSVDHKWKIESHLAISPDILFIGLSDRLAASPAELESCLATAVEELCSALDKNPEFSHQIKARSKP